MRVFTCFIFNPGDAISMLARAGYMKYASEAGGGAGLLSPLFWASSESWHSTGAPPSSAAIRRKQETVAVK